MQEAFEAILLGIIEGTVFRRSNSEVNAYVAAPLVAAKAQEAERDGCDAVVPFGTLDIGIELARHLIKIPIVGAAQATLNMAANLSRRIGVISYESTSIPFIRKNAFNWGVADRIEAEPMPCLITDVRLRLEVDHLRSRFDLRLVRITRGDAARASSGWSRRARVSSAAARHSSPSVLVSPSSGSSILVRWRASSHSPMPRWRCSA